MEVRFRKKSMAYDSGKKRTSFFEQIAFADIDTMPYQSGKFEGEEQKITKRGSKDLRKVGYEIMAALMSSKPKDDNAVYCLFEKRRTRASITVQLIWQVLISFYEFTMLV